MARLYTNENFPLPAVEELRRLGHDDLTIQESGQAGQAMPDEAVLAFAASEGRVLLTLNRRHFIRLHRQTSHHAGIVACTLDADFVGLANGFTRPSRLQTSLAGQLVRINRPPT